MRELSYRYALRLCVSHLAGLALLRLGEGIENFGERHGRLSGPVLRMSFRMLEKQ